MKKSVTSTDLWKQASTDLRTFDSSVQDLNFRIPRVSAHFDLLPVSLTIFPVTYTLTYLLTHSMQQVLLEKLTGSQLVMKFPTFYGTQRYIMAFTSAHHLPPILGQIKPVHAPTSDFLKIHPNIILPSTSLSPQWSLPLRFPHENLVHTSHIFITFRLYCLSIVRTGWYVWHSLCCDVNTVQ